MKLPESFYNVSSDDFAGGVELAFMSTSLDINVATEYAMRGTTKACTILEMPFDGASRGAGVQSLSQVPSFYHHHHYYHMHLYSIVAIIIITTTTTTTTTTTNINYHHHHHHHHHHHRYHY
jgi:hypothetical protein